MRAEEMERREPPRVKRTRLGAVRYLNAKPLLFGLERGSFRERYLIELDPPSRCALRLATGEVDLALIPSIEFARRPGYLAVPGVCIASDGPAASVLLFCKDRIERLRSVAVDSSSRSSAALLRILLRERWGTDPAFHEEPPDLTAMLSRHDAALMIGDRALFARRPGTEQPDGTTVFDLGAEWKTLTGLPFVFAFWAGRRGSAGVEEVAALQSSVEEGLAHLPEIAASCRWEGLTREDVALPYLRDHLWYRWRQRERDGLLRFFLLAGRHGLLEEVPEMSYFPEAGGATARGRRRGSPWGEGSTEGWGKKRSSA